MQSQTTGITDHISLLCCELAASFSLPYSKSFHGGWGGHTDLRAILMLYMQKVILAGSTPNCS